MTTNTYGTGSTYAFGQVVSSTSDTYTNNGNSTSGSPDSETSTTNTYIWRGGPLLSTITYDEDTTDSGSTDRVTTNTYSTLSALTNADIADGRARDADYITDHSGQVIRRDETDGKTSGTNYGDPHEVWHRFGGKQMGYVGNNGTTNTDYEASIADRTTTPDSNHTTQGAFRHGEHQSDPYSDFDQSYDRINSYNQGATAGTYTVRGGETLAGIAQTIYGDSGLWYKLAEANGLSASANLSAGTTLRLPTGVIRNTNNASTVRPHNPGETIGDISPTTPEPPKENKCGVMGQIMLVLVAVVVTAITAGATAGLGGFVSGAIAGATGSIVSQGVGVATGIQDKFSWKSVGISALTAGVSGGAGDVTNFKEFVTAAAKGAAVNAAVQGISVATGLQDKFSWSGVAAAGISAGVGGYAKHKFGAAALSGADKDLSFGNFAANMGVGAARGIANAATRSAIDGTSFGDNLIASIPDVIGQTFGDALSGAVGSPDIGVTPVDLGPLGVVIKGINAVGSTVSRAVDTVGNEVANVIVGSGRSSAPPPGAPYEPIRTTPDEPVIAVPNGSQDSDVIRPISYEYQSAEYDGRVPNNSYVGATGRINEEGIFEAIYTFRKHDRVLETIFMRERNNDVRHGLEIGANSQIPLISNISDLSLAAIDLIEGNKLGASGHAFFAIPGFRWGKSIVQGIGKGISYVGKPLLKGVGAIGRKAGQFYGNAKNVAVSSLNRVKDFGRKLATNIDGGVRNPLVRKGLKSLDELPYSIGDFQFTDAMNSKSFKRHLNDIKLNGFKNPIIKYVDIDGRPFVVVGNNRMDVARRLGMTGGLKFQKVDFPVKGTNFYSQQDVINAASNYRAPKIYGTR